MPLVDELLQPLDGSSPSGTDLRYTAIYDNLREARREDDDLNQGAWQRERKVADYAAVFKISADALKTKSKDIQIAAWLTDAWLRREGVNGLTQGFAVCRGLLEKFWDTLYPQLEDGDAELRAAPLDWIGSKLDVPLGNVPLTRDGYGHFRYKESRTVQPEDQAKDSTQKKAREKLLAEGKLAPELFDKSFKETPKPFYAELEKHLDASIAELSALAAVCTEKFVDDGPSFGKLRTALEALRHTVHGLLQKKREIEPDPVVEEPVAVPNGQAAATEAEGEASATHETNGWTGPESTAVRVVTFDMPASSESPGRQALVAQIANSAATLRAREPTSPAAYLMMRGLRWGDLRAAAANSDPNMLEAPPTEIRQQIKKLALNEKWKELLDVAEGAMALPCSRAWLDLQRFVVQALTALGSDYDTVAIAIRSELAALIRDLPQILDATLLDDTPAANETTRAWLLSLVRETAPPKTNGAAASLNHFEPSAPIRWERKHVDVQWLAKEAVSAGDVSKAFDLILEAINAETSARGRFHRKLQLVELCLAAGKETIAQPILDDLLASIDNHKLEDWEDRSGMAGALVTIMKASKKIQADAKEKQKYFERVCRLDPAQALNC